VTFANQAIEKRAAENRMKDHPMKDHPMSFSSNPDTPYHREPVIGSNAWHGATLPARSADLANIVAGTLLCAG
jgi:hypothetical protein